jgi:flavin reductase (DIM6/NTAB) family NADH-FMN oxidoreductase RutF
VTTQSDLEPDRYRAAMRRLVTGVCIVTARHQGLDHAMTVSSVASVSLDPMLVLFCVENEARFFDAVSEVDVFGVSILAADQRWVADWLATRGRPLHGQLDRVPHRPGPGTGVALLDGALATLECRITARHPGGDHTIVVGEVVTADVEPEAKPALIHHRSRYGHVD